MPLTTAHIEHSLAAADWWTTDNTAQALINGASTSDLAGVEAEGALRLYNALYSGIISSRDEAALARLLLHSRFQPVLLHPNEAVDAVRAAMGTNPVAASYLTVDTVNRIYAAENSRLSWNERMGFDGATVGRGQLGQPAFDDVRTTFTSAWPRWVERVAVSVRLRQHRRVPEAFWRSENVVEPQTDYDNVHWRTEFEDFVVAAYLSIVMKRATKPTRRSKDAARIAVALYHGMRGMVVAAQGNLTGADIDSWTKIEAELRAAGHNDAANYVIEVIP